MLPTKNIELTTIFPEKDKMLIIKLITLIKNVAEFDLPNKGLKLMLREINLNPTECFQTLQQIAANRLSQFHFYTLFKERNVHLQEFYWALRNEKMGAILKSLEAIVVDYVRKIKNLISMGEQINNATKTILFYKAISALTQRELADVSWGLLKRPHSIEFHDLCFNNIESVRKYIFEKNNAKYPRQWLSMVDLDKSDSLTEEKVNEVSRKLRAMRASEQLARNYCFCIYLDWPV